jgi:hypothetical protein
MTLLREEFKGEEGDEGLIRAIWKEIEEYEETERKAAHLAEANELHSWLVYN